VFLVGQLADPLHDLLVFHEGLLPPVRPTVVRAAPIMAQACPFPVRVALRCCR
jgi:hypothetical protein